MPKHDPEIVRDALREAIERAGSQSALATMIGDDVKTGHIFYWLKAGSVPEKHQAAIEEATGVSRKRMCHNWRRVFPELREAGDARKVDLGPAARGQVAGQGA